MRFLSFSLSNCCQNSTGLSSSTMFLSKVGRSLGSVGRLGQVLPECQQRFCTTTPPPPVTTRVEKTMNQVTLLGRVGADPQKRGTEEHPVVLFSLATHANYQYNSGNMLQKTEWHRICVFKPYLRDSVYKYVTKGQRVLVQGRISYGDIKDQNGVSHTTTSIVADDVTFFFSGNKVPTEVEEEKMEAEEQK